METKKGLMGLGYVIMFYTLSTNTFILFIWLIIDLKWMNKDYTYVILGILGKIFSYLKSAPPILMPYLHILHSFHYYIDNKFYKYSSLALKEGLFLFLVKLSI